MMKIQKVKHNDRFFIINTESFFYRNSDLVKEQAGDKDKFIKYQWVIPMYVYSINKIWNGAENFDLSPVNFSLVKNSSGNGWKWRSNYEYSAIGKTIFYTKKEAQDVYDKKYNDEQKKVYQELRRLRFLQEKNVNLI